ncbi:HNH endonuclease [Sphingopyxis sp. USTB-05]|uniref:HNH endonuclease n=1 Tax=Sphingopyxis sp. USTB-05 TaxID=2830667 RepID=UPI002078742F|nr:HNH endonuclease signature motif containing protein [Sphingopyxis sp. USTB-05]USI76530.1 HNH endonuclease [Sphingopyxis sp. USTB-05]
MWKDNPAAFAAKNGITLRQARLLQVTAEHLTPRADGGCDSDKNIVAACVYCNISRHKGRDVLSPDAYASKVRRQLQLGRWHGLLLQETN